MTDKKVTFDTGTNGAAIVTGGSYGGSAVDLASKSGSGAITISNTKSMHGTQSMRFTSTAAADTALIRETGYTGNDLSICFYLWLDAYPTSTTIVMGSRTSSAALSQAQITSAGLVQFTDPGGVAFTTSTALSLTQWNRIEMYIEVGTTTSNGKMTAAVYLGDSTTSVDSVFTSTTRNMGTTAVAAAQVGKTSATGAAMSGYIDDFRAADGTTGLLGPSPSNTAPTANAGAAQTNIEPWVLVTLDGSGSTDSDGTVASYAWTQTGGTTCTLSSSTAQKPTYTAPGTIAGNTQTWSLVVTDNAGASSTAATTTVAVLPVTERAVVGGVEVPMRTMSVISGVLS